MWAAALESILAQYGEFEVIVAMTARPMAARRSCAVIKIRGCA
jgi:hypothetical protein